jgi:uncharacterized protein (DUF1501 family)
MSMTDRSNDARCLASRRRFLRAASALAAAGGSGVARVAFASVPKGAAPTSAGYERLLVLVELKGGNDGFNTLVPYADAGYYRLRPKLAVARDAVIVLDDRVGLHPSLAPLVPMWRAGELAVLQGVGYPDPNLSHFRSIEIWDTASSSRQFLASGWLTRTFAAAPTPVSFAADGVVIGSNDMGPLAGGGVRALAMADAGRFIGNARLARHEPARGNAALRHLMATEDDIVSAAARLARPRAFATTFPSTAFGRAVRTACEVVAEDHGVAAVRITLQGFDTHRGQAGLHPRLLAELAEGLVALRGALTEAGRWQDTLALTYAEFGRRPAENISAGTDHGTASVHFALGGRVAGGLYGETPSLARIGGNDNVAHALDFRGVYTTVLGRWWNVDARDVLGGRFAAVPCLRV